MAVTESFTRLILDIANREAELIEALEAAVRSGDKDLAWQIAQAICRNNDQAYGRN